MSWTLSAHLCSQNSQPRSGGGGKGEACAWTVKCGLLDEDKGSSHTLLS